MTNQVSDLARGKKYDHDGREAEQQIWLGHLMQRQALKHISEKESAFVQYFRDVSQLKYMRGKYCAGIQDCQNVFENPQIWGHLSPGMRRTGFRLEKKLWVNGGGSGGRGGVEKLFKETSNSQYCSALL